MPTSDRVAGTAFNTAPNNATALSWVRTFSPTFFNDLLLSVSREGWTDSTGQPGVKYADQIGTSNPFGVPGWPGLYDTGLTNYYFETGNPQGSAFTHLILDNNATKRVAPEVNSEAAWRVGARKRGGSRKELARLLLAFERRHGPDWGVRRAALRALVA